MDFETALSVGIEPLWSLCFLIHEKKDLEMFIEIRQEGVPETKADVSTLTLIPAFVISELKTIFKLAL